MLKVREVAERLKVSVSKIYELVEKGKLAHHRIDGAIRVSEDQLADYLEKTKREREEPNIRNRKLSRPQLRFLRSR